MNEYLKIAAVVVVVLAVVSRVAALKSVVMGS